MCDRHRVRVAGDGGGSSLLCSRCFWVFPPGSGTHNMLTTQCLVTDPQQCPGEALAGEASTAVPPGSGPPASLRAQLFAH